LFLPEQIKDIIIIQFLRESVLFIGTQFSILYTSMYSPAEFIFSRKQKPSVKIGDLIDSFNICKNRAN